MSETAALSVAVFIWTAVAVSVWASFRLIGLREQSCVSTLQPARRLSRWIEGIFVAVAAAALGGALVLFAPGEERLEPEPFRTADINHYFKEGDVLSPELQHLLSELQVGHVVGAQAATFQADLEKAHKTATSGRFTTYVFFKYPELGAKEGSPFLAVVVQRKFGHIVRCSILELCY